MLLFLTAVRSCVWPERPSTLKRNEMSWSRCTTCDRVHITQQERGRRDQSPQTRPDKMKDTHLSLDPVTWFQGKRFHVSLMHSASNRPKHSKAFGKMCQLQQLKYLHITVDSAFHTLTNKINEFIQGSPDKNLPTSHMLTPFCLYA